MNKFILIIILFFISYPFSSIHSQDSSLTAAKTCYGIKVLGQYNGPTSHFDLGLNIQMRQHQLGAGIDILFFDPTEGNMDRRYSKKYGGFYVSYGYLSKPVAKKTSLITQLMVSLNPTNFSEYQGKVTGYESGSELHLDGGLSIGLHHSILKYFTISYGLGVSILLQPHLYFGIGINPVKNSR